jgi:hypothetical protein
VLLATPLLLWALSANAPAQQASAADIAVQADAEDAGIAQDQQSKGDTASTSRPEPEPQKPADAKEPPTPPHTGVRALFKGLGDDILHLPSKPNLYIALVGGGVAYAVHPVDQEFNVQLRSQYTAVNTAFLPAKYFGDTPEQVGIALVTYAYGRIADAPKVSHFGMDLLRAQIVCEILVQPIKFATQRRRPDDSNSLSFPSGHSCSTFAAATVIERHLGWRGTAIGYSIATYVAASRLHDNRHFLSDVAFGAALGVIAGRTVTEHGRDVWTLVPAGLPGGGAVLLARSW